MKRKKWFKAFICAIKLWTIYQHSGRDSFKTPNITHLSKKLRMYLGEKD